MKSRHQQLLDHSIAAMVAAIEIYNKPNFLYREETFAILAINGWELLLKAKWLADNGNKIQTLYVKEKYTKKDGSKSKRSMVKKTRSGNSVTLGLDYLARKLVETQTLDSNALNNIEALIDMRNSSIHFYNRSENFSMRLQEVGMASIRNFVTACNKWFKRDLSEYNFYLMPLSFVEPPQATNAVLLNKEEQRFLNFVETLESGGNDTSPYHVTCKIEVKLARSKSKEAPNVRITNDPNAPGLRVTEECIREKYPWDYSKLTAKCRKRFSDFKVVKKYHGLRKHLLNDSRFGMVRLLDPNNPKGPKKQFFNPNIMREFDKHYAKK